MLFCSKVTESRRGGEYESSHTECVLLSGAYSLDTKSLLSCSLLLFGVGDVTFEKVCRPLCRFLLGNNYID